jgi:two-component sensor histidine kinase
MQSRISAIAQLYDLISQSSRGRAIGVDAYLAEIAKTLAETLLGDASDIRIRVESEPLEIDADRAVPFGLLVNELVTNSIKHAFPEGRGVVLLRVAQVGDHLELTVSDNGVGMNSKAVEKIPGNRGSDYVAIFVRQLKGSIMASEARSEGTSVCIRVPLLLISPGDPGLQAA